MAALGGCGGGATNDIRESEESGVAGCALEAVAEDPAAVERAAEDVDAVDSIEDTP